MEDISLAATIFVANVVVALVALAWCNKKIEDITDHDKWKK